MNDALRIQKILGVVFIYTAVVWQKSCQVGNLFGHFILWILLQPFVGKSEEKQTR